MTTWDIPFDLPRIPRRTADSHKGSYGHVLILGGKRGMAGAVALAGIAALRGGAGLVTVACPTNIADVVASHEPSLITAPIELIDKEGRLLPECLLELLERNFDVVAIGPGMGQGGGLTQLVIRTAQQFQKPIVIDADALNAIAGHTKDLTARTGITVLTPHPGEMARLAGLSAKEVQNDRIHIAKRMALESRSIVVLKGNRSVITDGTAEFLNETGNPGMATGGSGDVLTGLVASFLAQNQNAMEAVRLAVFAHGLAGDIAAREFGEASLIASDLLHKLPEAIQQITADTKSTKAG